MAHLEDASAEYLVICYSLGTQITGFTGTIVQILLARYAVYWLYWYKRTNTDAEGAAC